MEELILRRWVKIDEVETPILETLADLDPYTERAIETRIIGNNFKVVIEPPVDAELVREIRKALSVKGFHLIKVYGNKYKTIMLIRR